MSFVSLNFLIFIAIVFLLYFIVPSKYKWGVLLTASYAFYAFSDIKMMFLIILTTVSVFTAGILIDKINSKQQDLFKEKNNQWLKDNKKRYRELFTKQKRRILVVTLLFNFGILSYLKYFNFILDNINSALSKFSIASPVSQLNLLLPLGISFYTFQSLGYIIDVYRGKYPADRNIAKFALFVSFFPQIIQGPISRYDQLAHQLYEPHYFEYLNFKYGLQLILWGFFKKIIIADRAALLVNSVLPNYTQYAGFEIGFAILLFLIQVYADFSGGIDVARGVAQCFGIDMEQNFERPHFAVSISDYWKRWHITLGTWMKDYLLYSVTFSKWFSKFNKKSKKYLGNYFGRIIPVCVAMSLVFFVVGIWHGASWKYIAFGFYNGGLIVIGTLLSGPKQKLNKKYPTLTTEKNIFVRISAIIGVFFLVFIGKYFAAAASFTQALELLKSTFSVFNPSALLGSIYRETGFGSKNMIMLVLTVFIFFVVSLMQENGIRVRDFIARRNIVIRWAIYLIAIFTILCFSVENSMSGFIYQRF